MAKIYFVRHPIRDYNHKNNPRAPLTIEREILSIK